MDGMWFSPSGRLSSSCTRWASRIGSSSERNCEARNNVPGANNQYIKPGLKQFNGSKLTCGWCLPELNHLAKTDSSCRKAGVMLDALHQLFGRFPRHDVEWRQALLTRITVRLCLCPGAGRHCFDGPYGFLSHEARSGGAELALSWCSRGGGDVRQWLPARHGTRST